MRTISINLYQFAELSETAKKKALQNLSDINVDDSWWDQVYEDAGEAGIKITGFDTDRGSYCSGEFINGGLRSADYILANHGEVCATYKTALRYRDNLKAQEHTEEYEDIEAAFLNEVLLDYLKLLREDLEYKYTEEAIIETIEANEYEFKEDGTRY